MSYGNDYSNKPFERASKTSHTNIINDAAVQSFLSKCKIPPYFEEIDDKDVELHMLEELDENPIKNIITISSIFSQEKIAVVMWLLIMMNWILMILMNV